jgi:NAD(P)H-nitrite reductase large subunit
LADIYAAGDVISVEDRLTGERYVHANFPNAVDQGRVVGLNLAGFDTCYEGAERMNSLKHLDLPIMAVGLKDGDEILSAKSNGSQRRIYLQDGRVVGYQLVGDIHAAGALRTLMTRGENVARYKDRLLDRNFGQADLAWRAILV